MRHDCSPYTCGYYHPELRPRRRDVGLPTHGTVAGKARRRTASKAARRARKATR